MATLLVKLKRFKEAFEVAARNLDLQANEHLADFAIRILKADDQTKVSQSSTSGKSKERKVQSPEGLIFTEMYAALVTSGSTKEASIALKNHAKNIDMLSVLDKYIEDDQLVDDAMFEAFTKVFVDLEQQKKHT